MIPAPTSQTASRRLGAARAENRNGRSRRWGVRQFAYDENGSMLREYDQNAGTTTYYAYADNGLASRMKPGVAAATYFHYDARMQRFAIDFGVTLAYFAWDGLNQLEERQSDLSLETQHTHGATPIQGIGSMVVTKHVYAPDRFEYPHYDHRGTLFFLEDTGFGYLDMEFNAFGEELYRFGDAFTRFGYQGTAWMRLDSGLYVSPTRLYVPGAGVFSQKDPLPLLLMRGTQGRLVGGDPIRHAGGIGLYGYARVNPSMYTDPWGLLWWKHIKDDVWEATLIGARLHDLAEEVSKDREDWACIWPVEHPTEGWAPWETGEYSVGVANECARADVSNLTARPTAELIINFAPEAGFRKLYPGTYLTKVQEVVDKIAKVSGEGKTPIGRFVITGHPTTRGVQRERGFGTSIDWADITARSQSPTFERGKAKKGPARCWFSRSAVVRIVGCSGTSAARSFASTLLRDGAVAYGIHGDVETNTYAGIWGSAIDWIKVLASDTTYYRRKTLETDPNWRRFDGEL